MEEQLGYVTTEEGLFPAISETETALHKAKIVHVSHLGFRNTPKKPLNDTCLMLAEHFLAEGFLSGSHPILLMHVHVRGSLPCLSNTDGTLANMCLQYYSGQSRACTLLALLMLLWEDVDVAALTQCRFEKLFGTVASINVHMINVTTTTAWIIGNASLAARSSVRKAWSVVTWMEVLSGFATKGREDPQAVIKAWNAQAVASNQIVGAKRMALNHLLALNDETQTSIFNLVSFSGWSKSPFTEDFLASKKIAIGAKRVAGPKSWQRLTIITPESFLLFIRHLNHGVRAGNVTRRTKAELEDLCCQLAIGANLADMVQQEQPVPTELLKSGWLDPLVAGASSQLAEVFTVFTEKKEQLLPCHVRTLDLLITSWKQQHVSNKSSPASTTWIEQSKLEDDTFQLLLNRIKMDAQVFSQWRKRCSDAETAWYFAERQRQQDRFNMATETARVWIKNNVAIKSAEGAEFDHGDLVLSSLWESTARFKESSTQRAMDLIHLSTLNWAVPGTIRAELQTLQKRCVHAILEQSPGRNLCVLIMPKYSYTPNTLWLQHVNVLQWLGSTKINGEMVMSILFSKRHHKLDERPLNYDGRILFMGPAHDFLSHAMWRGSTLVSSGAVVGVEQLKVQDLTKVEYADDEELPPAPVFETRVPVALKYSQLGQAAWNATFNCLLDGPIPPNTGIIISDINPGSADGAKAFVDLKQKINCPLSYWCLAETDRHSEWIAEELHDYVISEVLQHRLGDLPKVDCSTDKAPLPTKPNLLQCVYGTHDSDSLHIPEKDVIAWQNRSGQLKEYVQSVAMETGISLLFEPPPGAGLGDGSANKRSLEKQVAETPEKKTRAGTPEQKPCVSAVINPGTVAIDTITEKVLCKCVLSQVSATWEFIFVAGDAVYLLNRDTEPSTLQPDTVVLGFGRGKWEQHLKPDEVTQVDVEYKLTDDKSLLIFNKAVMEAGALLHERKQANPSRAKFYYHELHEAPIPGNPSAFNLTQKVQTYFRSSEQKVDATEQGPLTIPWVAPGAMAPTSLWTGSQFFHVLFTCKETRKGIQPSSPNVVTKCALTVPSMHALCIS